MRRKLIEVALPLEAISAAGAREKGIRHGHPSSLHLWWSRKPIAACKAVLFAQLVDDPSAWPEEFPAEGDQERERERLFRILEQLVEWDHQANGRVKRAARWEVARSVARERLAADRGGDADRAVLKQGAPAEVVDAYLESVAPPVHDPFVGGGTTALAARWLGLRSISSDLNPVALLVTRALVEVPGLVADLGPVHPDLRGKPSASDSVAGSLAGLDVDVRAYGEWMQQEAQARLGTHYPEVRVTREIAGERPDLQAYVGRTLTVATWLWARTVRSPDPAMDGAHVPLVSSLWLSTKASDAAFLHPVADPKRRAWRLEVRRGKPLAEANVATGTKVGRGVNFRCLLSGSPIDSDYLRQEAQAGRLGLRMTAVIIRGEGGRRLFLEPTHEMEAAAQVPEPPWRPTEELVKNSRHMSPWAYGGETYDKLFLPRQLLAMTTCADLVSEVHSRVQADAIAAGLDPDQPGLAEGGTGARAYADAVATYLACAVDRFSDYWSSLNSWEPSARTVSHAFTRQALALNWNIAEMNPFSGIAGSFQNLFDYTVQTLPGLSVGPAARCRQSDATKATPLETPAVVCTDPPYANTVPYGDISDFFYVWLRRCLRGVFPDLFRTVLVPKEPELIADPFRHGTKVAARQFFTDGMARALENLFHSADVRFPVAIFYAYKESESVSSSKGRSTGWETFLEAVVRAGFAVVGTWPFRTEHSNRMRARSSNALASSVVLVCRRRLEDAPTLTLREFQRTLRREIPVALRALQQGNVAPVDLAQASIGPGMAVFSQHAQILEADGARMTVGTALALINQALDEYLSEETGELDPETRFALLWFKQHQHNPGTYGDAETLAKACNVSVAGVAEAGLLKATAGQVRLLRRAQLPEDWDPTTDRRATVWEGAQHLIKQLELGGEEAAAQLLAQLGPIRDRVRGLAYRLHNIADRRGWAEEAQAYNSLVVAWPEIERQAGASLF